MGYMLIILIFKADYTAILKITARYHGIKLETVFKCVYGYIYIFMNTVTARILVILRN